MLIEIKDLKVGDEIIFSINSSLRYLKVTRPPFFNKKTNRWSNRVWGTTKVNENTYTGYRGRSVIYHTYECTPDGHNIEKPFSIGYRKMWLVKDKSGRYEDFIR